MEIKPKATPEDLYEWHTLGLQTPTIIYDPEIRFELMPFGQSLWHKGNALLAIAAGKLGLEEATQQLVEIMHEGSCDELTAFAKVIGTSKRVLRNIEDACKKRVPYHLAITEACATSH